MSRSSRSDRTLYVGNLPGDIREREVEDLFYKYGSIVHIELKVPPRPPGYAFVEFEDVRDAEDAIRGRDGYYFDGHLLRVNFIMAIKVHGHPLSPAAQRVIVCLEEKEIEYDTVLVDLRTGEQKKEPFISINPFGQVPGFEDGDLKLYESRAITRYVAHTYADKGTPLLPEDPKKMGTVFLWLEVEVLKFDASAQKIAFEILIKPMKGMTTDEAAVEQLQDQLSAVLDVYEARLAESKYLAGDRFTLADLHHLPVINNLSKTKVKALFDARPHVSAWCADILARPAWKKALEVKY